MSKIISAQQGVSQDNSAETITIIGEKFNRRLGKRIYRDPATGELAKQDFKSAMHVSHTVRKIKDLPSAFELYREIASKPSFATVRGEFLPHNIIVELDEARKLRLKQTKAELAALPKEQIGEDEALANKRELLRARIEDDSISLYEVYEKKNRDKTPASVPYYLRRQELMYPDRPKHLLILDIDRYRVSDDPIVWTPETIPEIIDKALFEELGIRDVEYFYQLSSSAAVPFKGKENIFSGKVFMWLEKPLDGFELRAWWKNRTALLQERDNDPKRVCRIDKSLFTNNQICYITPPEFDGVSDPIADLAEIFGEFPRLAYISKPKKTLIIPEYEEIKEAGRISRENCEFDDEGTHDDREYAFNRPGIVGATNRAWPMSDFINKKASDKFTIHNNRGRVSWNDPRTSGGSGGCKILPGNTTLHIGHNSSPFDHPATVFDIVQELMCDGSFGRAVEEVLRWEGVQEQLAQADFDIDAIPQVAIIPTSRAKEVGVAKVRPLETPESIAAKYPSPYQDFKTPDLECSYFYKKLGRVWWLHEKRIEKNRTNKKGLDIGDYAGTEPLFSPVIILEEAVCAKTKRETVKFLLRNPDGEDVSKEIARGEVTKHNLPKVLGDLGWRYKPKTGYDDGPAERFVEHVMGNASTARVVSLPARGWDDGLSCFAIPADGSVVGAASVDGRKRRLATEQVLPEKIGRGGSMEGWQKAVTLAVGAKKVPHWSLGVAAGFCGPLMELLKLPTRGVVLSATTTTGKTVALSLAVSPWGHPSVDNVGGLATSFKVTKGGVEVVATRADGTILALDELHLAPKRELNNVIYTISHGGGTEGKTQTGGIRENLYSWTTFAFITGEKTPEEYINSVGGEALGGGADVRLWGIPVDGYNNDKSLKDLVARFETEGTFNNYGVAGKIFVEGLFHSGLVADPTWLRAEHARIISEITTKSTSAKNTRTAAIPAVLILAAQLLARFDMLGKETCNKIESDILGLWKIYLKGPVAKTEDGMIEKVRSYLLSHLGETIFNVSEAKDKTTKAKEGYYDDNMYWIFSNTLAKAAGDKVTAAEVARVLRVNKYIPEPTSGKNLARRIPKVGGNAYPLYIERLGTKTEGDKEHTFVIQKGFPCPDKAELDGFTESPQTDNPI